MKKAILILGAAFILAGCNQEQGGTSDTYSTGTNGATSRSPSRSSTNGPSVTDTNQLPKTTP
jgi:predicted small secreted protein